MSPTVDGAGVVLAYSEHGSGTPVLLIHGMGLGARQWDGLARALGERARVIAYDRRGYGASGSPMPYERTTVEEQAEDAAALIAVLDAGPALLCGADLGALVCLDVLKRHRGLVRGAVLVDAPLLAFVPAATEALAAERFALEVALREGGPEAALRDYLTMRGVGPEQIQAALPDHAAFFADYAGLASWPVTRRELRAIDAPLVVLDSQGAPGYLRAAGDALVELAPRARRGSGNVVDELGRLIG